MINLEPKNIEITPDELRMLRGLPDFDLIMVISDINDVGWERSRKTLLYAHNAVEFNNGQPTNEAGKH